MSLSETARGVGICVEEGCGGGECQDEKGEGLDEHGEGLVCVCVCVCVWCRRSRVVRGWTSCVGTKELKGKDCEQTRQAR